MLNIIEIWQQTKKVWEDKNQGFLSWKKVNTPPLCPSSEFWRNSLKKHFVSSKKSQFERKLNTVRSVSILNPTLLELNQKFLLRFDSCQTIRKKENERFVCTRYEHPSGILFELAKAKRKTISGQRHSDTCESFLKS